MTTKKTRKYRKDMPPCSHAYWVPTPMQPANGVTYEMCTLCHIKRSSNVRQEPVNYRAPALIQLSLFGSLDSEQS